MTKPFRRFVAVLGLACPAAAFAQIDLPKLPTMPPEVVKQVQATAPPATLPPIPTAPAAPSAPVAPSAATVAAATTETASDVVPLVADRFWFGGDFFLGVRSGANVPPLLTTSTQPQSVILRGGLGRPGTSVAFGGREKLNSFGPGYRFNVGVFLDDAKTFSIDGNMTSLYDQFENFEIGRNGVQGLFVPVNRISPTPGFTGPVGFPFGQLSLTNAFARIDTEFIGADTNLRYGLISNDDTRLDVLVGYRYAHLRDAVTLDTAGVGSTNILPFSFSTTDSFRTRNDFHGVNMGVSGTRRLGGRFTLSGRATVALGQTYTETQVFGGSTFATPLTGFGGFLAGLFRPLPANTGLLANASNRGDFHSRHFAVIPEGSARLGYDFSDRFRSTIGYTYQYWSSVKRAGDQIATPTVNSTGFPFLAGTAVRSAVPDQNTDFTVQGVTFGVELKY